MEINARREGRVVIISVVGRIIGYECALELKKAVDTTVEGFEKDGAPIFIVLNLSEVSLIDSEGIGALVAARISIKNKGGRIVLAVPEDNRSVRDHLSVTKLNLVLKIYPTEERAVRSFQTRVKKLVLELAVPLVPHAAIIGAVLDEARREFEEGIAKPFNTALAQFQLEQGGDHWYCFRLFTDPQKLKGDEVAIGVLFHVFQSAEVGPAVMVRFLMNGKAEYKKCSAEGEGEVSKGFWGQVLVRMVDFIKGEMQQLDFAAHEVPRTLVAVGKALEIANLLWTEED